MTRIWTLVFLTNVFVLSGGLMAEEDNVKEKAESYKLELSEAEIKEKLNPMQYKVMRKDGTEPPFKNEYWDNKEQGIYVDVLTGEPLFSSTHKYKSGTGWPSFYKSIDDKYIVKKKDFKLIWPRTEIRSKNGNNHLGHVFDDGPEPTGKRYCMNSAALKFIAKDKMEAEGYAKYLSLFSTESSN